jgi:hypothetical protein
VDDTQLLRLLNETRDDIARAETKASIALAAASLVSGSVFSALLDNWADVVPGTKAVLVGCLAATLVGLVSLGLALIPNVFANRGGHHMVAYFGHVTAAGTIDEFERLADEPQDERQRLTNQIWTLSVLTMRKYAHIRRAFLALGAAIALGMLAMLVEAIAS